MPEGWWYKMNHRMKIGWESHVKLVLCLCQDGLLAATGWRGALDPILLVRSTPYLTSYSRVHLTPCFQVRLTTLIMRNVNRTCRKDTLLGRPCFLWSRNYLSSSSGKTILSSLRKHYDLIRIRVAFQ